uniref:MHC class II beta chain N-terminal domain-containing protein n=1 Tax=Acanthochromis polyacanthus TaxID=80966 RepID=A0A3Q1GEP7_9TELE
MGSSSVSFLLLFIIVHLAGRTNTLIYGFMHYSKTHCAFNSTELKDIEYIRSFYYNKLEYLRFSSSLGKFVGYTEFGVKTAEQWNKDTALLSAERAQKETYCLPNIKIRYTNMLPVFVVDPVLVFSLFPRTYSGSFLTEERFWS